MADPTPAPSPEPTLDEVRARLAALGGRLVDVESNPTVELARTGCLTGVSAAAWADADADLARAWEVYRGVDDVVRAAEAEPDRAWVRLSLTKVPGPDGPTDPSSALRAAEAAVDAASGVAARLSAAWDGLGARVTAAGTAAKEAGDTSATRAVDSVAELLANDPLAVTDADVAEVEREAEAARARRAATATASARIDVDLARARRTHAELEAAVQGAAGELAHAASRIAGLAAAAPVPDMAALGDWLDRIAGTAASDPARAAADLASWDAAAAARRAELDRALAPARQGMRRREEGRGLWTAMRAKASARRLDERSHVAAALTAAHDELWQAPCDLAAAEAALAELARLLESPARSTR